MSIIKPYSKKSRKSFTPTGESLTKQSFKNECDINVLLARYRKNGMLEHVARFNGDYADISSVPTYHDAMQRVVEAQEAFDSLPAQIRKDMSNDPGVFLEFVSDEKNLEKMQEYGLIPIPTPEQPIEVVVTNPQPTE